MAAAYTLGDSFSQFRVDLPAIQPSRASCGHLHLRQGRLGVRNTQTAGKHWQKGRAFHLSLEVKTSRPFGCAGWLPQTLRVAQRARWPFCLHKVYNTNFYLCQGASPAPERHAMSRPKTWHRLTGALRIGILIRMNIELPVVICLRCGHQWSPRVRTVIRCARCKSRFWETERTTRQGLRPEPQPERRTR